ncbi:MAG: response regulator transcription factor [Burkholderiaceae bacterium]|nr:response regulator transcription factor [Burkholderiaceae bacterium]
MATQVLIVEDEPAFQRRLADAVLADPQLSLLAMVSSGNAAKSVLDAQAPDVMLVDLGLPDIDGIEVIRHAARHRPGCDVMVVTMFGDERHLMSSIEAGATGYLLKDASDERIAAAIHELRAGGAPISPSLARRVLARLRVGNPAPNGAVGDTPGAGAPAAAVAPAAAPGGVDSPLTEREAEILRMIAKGLSFETVAAVLGISAHTVVTHVKKIYRKLAVHSRGEAVYEAGQMGLL